MLRENSRSKELESIDRKLSELREQMTNLVCLNTRDGLDAEIYEEEYERLLVEMEELRQKRLIYTNKELQCRSDALRVKEIEKILREKDLIEKFDEDVFQTLVEQVRVISLVEVEFVLKIGIVEREVL